MICSFATFAAMLLLLLLLSLLLLLKSGGLLTCLVNKRLGNLKTLVTSENGNDGEQPKRLVRVERSKLSGGREVDDVKGELSLTADRQIATTVDQFAIGVVRGTSGAFDPPVGGVVEE